jgi:hypothetical protein
MPRFDGTGPMGQGAMTGGGRGYCAVNINICEAGVRQGVGCGFSGRGNRFRGRSRDCLAGCMEAMRGRQAFGGFGRAASS